jgi:C-terminal processing protease CtpA/Prc
MLIRSLFILFFTLIWSILPLIARVDQATMLHELGVIKYNLSLKYAPADWKRDLCGWDIDIAFEKAKQRILLEAPLTSRQYQKIFREFLQSTKDYHVNPLFYSTEWSFFPLQVQTAKGRYFVTGFGPNNFDIEDFCFDMDEVDEEVITSNVTDIKPGDEILEINGMRVQQIIEKIIKEDLRGDRSPTGYALAAKTLFLRRAKFGQYVPTGTFKITLRHPGDQETFTRQLPWIHTPEWIVEPDSLVQSGSFLEAIKIFNPPLQDVAKILCKDFSVAFAKDLVAIPHSFNRLDCFLNREKQEKQEDKRQLGELPPLGKVIWESKESCSTYAYLFKNAKGKKIGYIYLPTFMYVGEEANLMFKEVKEILQLFQEKAEALVVDITNNPGGNLLYTYAVLSALINRPLEPFTQQETLIQEDVYNAAMLYQTLIQADTVESLQSISSGYYLSHTSVRNMCEYYQEIMHLWKSGQQMTPHLYPMGIKEIIPHPEVQFDKPLIVLINELDFSCADIFPAILQDNGRALLLGNKTAGAGGYVRSYSHMSQLGIKGYSLTGSILFRLNGQPLEDLGVIPDVPCQFTLKDLRNNYCDYIHTVNHELDQLLNKK